jgi:hypothetical protein
MIWVVGVLQSSVEIGVKQAWTIDFVFETNWQLMNNLGFAPTNDRVIRTALKEKLWEAHRQEPQVRIIEELGITHGAARVDIAVVNGIIHGYELKSDLDTLHRLPEQMRIYNSVLDQVTLVVGKNHLYEAINTVPEWWGITIAKAINSSGAISFCNIRRAEDNPEKNSVDIASLLWRDEALCILEEMDQSRGVRSKPRKFLYERLADVLDQPALRAKVRECLSVRKDWRFEKPCMQGGD